MLDYICIISMISASPMVLL